MTLLLTISLAKVESKCWYTDGFILPGFTKCWYTDGFILPGFTI